MTEDYGFFKFTIRHFQPIFRASKVVTITLWKSAWAIFYYTKVLEKRDKVSESKQMKIAKKLIVELVLYPDFAALPVIQFLNRTYLFGKNPKKAVAVNGFLDFLELQLGYPNWLSKARDTVENELQLSAFQDNNTTEGTSLHDLTPEEQEFLTFVIICNMSLSEDASTRSYNECERYFEAFGGDKQVIRHITKEIKSLGELAVV